MNQHVKNIGLACGIIVMASVSSTGIAASMYGQSVEANVPFVVGGVGNEARMELEQLSPRYGLRVTNATQAGEFVTDVRLRLRDANDRIVLDTIARGPILLADPAPGVYSLESEFEGQNQTRKIRVLSGGQTEVISNWRDA